ncbi:MAG: FAD-binding protein [Caldilineaceae bacterium]|nr:FAD-binding protein [Caldilineaceae bacterium]MDE0312561.1 FAD-binding protein [Caldilineaceae bacterium]
MNSVDEIQEAVRGAESVRVRGGGSKPSLSLRRCQEDVQWLDLSTLRGVIDYQPEEYTFTARAGTPVAEMSALLEEKGQYLPFDPPLAERGATLGGTVASGLSGAGRYRYGGIRDFLIGVRFVDGKGQEVRGGGAVVKNAAGFDFPKLFVGSLGRLGVLTELTFKVFPQPPAFATVAAEFNGLSELLSALDAVTRSAIDLHAVDFAPTQKGWTLWVRIGGLLTVLQERAQALQAVVSAGAELAGDLKLYQDQEDEDLWQTARSMGWLEEAMGLVRVPLTPRRIPAVENALGGSRATMRRYSVGGNLLWLGWPDAAATAGGEQGSRGDLHRILLELGLQGVQLIGRARRAPKQRDGDNIDGGEDPLLGRPLQNAFLRRIALALDPEGKFEQW